MADVIVTFENSNTNMKSYVTKGRKGYHVSLQDLDSGCFSPLVTIYPFGDGALVKATNKAQEVMD